MLNLNPGNKENQVVLNHLQLAKALSMKFPNLPYEDRFQEACLGLMKAYHSYKPDKDVSFGSYAKAVIMNQLLQYYKKEKMRLLFIIESDEYDKIQDGSCAQSSIDYYGAIELKEDLKKRFGNFKVKVLVEIVNGKTQKDCSQTFGISQPSVSRIIKRMRETLEVN